MRKKGNIIKWLKLLTRQNLISAGATLAGLPPGTLYRVRATYRYTREDSDELSFEVGDIIRVVEYDDPEEQVRSNYF